MIWKATGSPAETLELETRLLPSSCRLPLRDQAVWILMDEALHKLLPTRGLPAAGTHPGPLAWRCSIGLVSARQCSIDIV